MTTSLINHLDFIALDTETGGLNAAECALLSIACQPSWEAPAFSVCVLPVGRVDAKAAEVNGYSAEEWARRGAVTPKVALMELQQWLHQTKLQRRTKEPTLANNVVWRFDMAAHNAGFDLLFMLAAQERTGIDLELPGVWHCTKIGMEEAHQAGRFEMLEHKSYAGTWRYRLDDLGRESGFWKLEPRAKAHDALQDARCCAHGLKWLRGLPAKKKGGN
jgi:DNA polymerase III epsilon subunit-like protein